MALMKKLLLFFLFTSSMMFAQQVSQTEAPPAQSNASGQQASGNSQGDPYAVKARGAIDLMIKTLGGQPYPSHQTRTEEGRTYTFYQGSPKGAGTQYWRFWKY